MPGEGIARHSQSRVSGEPVPGKNPRWTDIKAIFDLAVTLDSAEWAAFLDLKCGSDSVLRKEVESLLNAHGDDSGFLEEPVASLDTLTGGETEIEPLGPEIGTRIGAYRLEKEIGRGGMGHVYLANRDDDEFLKQVAIKLIRVEKHSDFTVQRFRQERQILARLEHPYIARLIDGGTTDFGMPYFVMEHVEGKVLTTFCETHGLTGSERLSLLLKICSAVQYAHECRVIHRDLKPANVLVQENGDPKLLDFGIAKILEPEDPTLHREATAAGMRMLTPAYASPEQMHGEAATEQSDVYSLGVIAYELLCGNRPTLKTVQQGSDHVGETEAHLSPALRAIVFNAIRPDPSERYISVAALATDIERYLQGAPTNAGSALSRDLNPDQISIGILPFRELGSDKNADPFLRSAITDALITRLSKVDRLSVRPTTAVLKYSQSHNVVNAARELRVQYVLEGTFHTVGENIRLNVQLVSAETGLAVWAARFEEQSSDLLHLEDSISEQIAFALIPQLTGEERLKLSRAGTANGRAHQSYLRGRYHWSRSAGEPEELAKALVCFMQAISEDPQYARAHAGLADYYVRLALWGGTPPSESFAAALDAARQAISIDPNLGEAHASLGFCYWAYERDYAKAEREFNLAIALSPDSANAHHWFGLLNSARGRSELAFANLDRARKLDPNSPVIAAAFGFVHYNARQYERSIQLLLMAARERRKSAVIQEMLTWGYLQLSDHAKALDCARRAVDLADRSPASLAALARVEAAGENREAAADLLHEMEKLQEKRYVSGYDRASAFLALGDVKGTLACLKEAVDARDWWTSWLNVDARWDPLREDARFQQLLLRTHPPETHGTEIDTTVPMQNRKRKVAAVIFAAAACLLLIAGVMAWRSFHSPSVAFAHPEFTRLTGDGTAGLAAISPDGQYIVYTTAQRGQTQFWRRKLGSSVSENLIPSVPGEVANLSFTRNGKDVAFELHPVLRPFDGEIYEIPVAGGQPKQVVADLPGPGTISRDGNTLAVVKFNADKNQDEMWLKNLKSGNKRMLLACSLPERLSPTVPPAWSRDGKMIAYAIESRDHSGFSVHLNSVEVATGKKRRITSPRWLWVEHLEWVNGTSGLAIVARQQDSAFRQIYYLSYPGGAVKRLGHDIESYTGVSATDSGSALVAVQLQTLANLYVSGARDIANPAQISPGTGRYFDLSWTNDGRILYASDATGEANIWSINKDGSDQRQLITGPGLSWAPAASPDGKYIAYHSNRAGDWDVWRADATGRGAVQLTYGARDSKWPHFTQDSANVLFDQTEANGVRNVWTVPVGGGEAHRLTSAMALHPAVSLRDGKIAAWYSELGKNLKWKIAIFSPQGGAPIKSFTIGPAISPESQLSWTSSGEEITCLGQENGVWNLWVQPVDGRPARKLTSFQSGQIYSFDWSPEGELALSHGVTTSDVVMLRDTQSGS